MSLGKATASMAVPETQLIARAQEGDEAAVESLYRLHSRRVYSLCLRMTRNEAAAEDLTQEIFLQVFRKIRTFRGEAAFSTWLYRLGTNIVLMSLRKKERAEVSLEEVTQPDEVINPIRQADPTQTLVDRLSLRHAVDQLPEGFKSAIVLHDIQGYEHNEIAELTGRSVGNSKSQLHKARRRLRELLTIPSPAR